MVFQAARCQIRLETAPLYVVFLPHGKETDNNVSSKSDMELLIDCWFYSRDFITDKRLCKECMKCKVYALSQSIVGVALDHPKQTLKYQILSCNVICAMLDDIHMSLLTRF